MARRANGEAESSAISATSSSRRTVSFSYQSADCGPLNWLVSTISGRRPHIARRMGDRSISSARNCSDGTPKQKETTSMSAVGSRVSTPVLAFAAAGVIAAIIGRREPRHPLAGPRPVEEIVADLEGAGVNSHGRGEIGLDRRVILPGSDAMWAAPAIGPARLFRNQRLDDELAEGGPAGVGRAAIERSPLPAGREQPSAQQVVDRLRPAVPAYRVVAIGAAEQRLGDPARARRGIISIQPRLVGLRTGPSRARKNRSNSAKSSQSLLRTYVTSMLPAAFRIAST